MGTFLVVTLVLVIAADVVCVFIDKKKNKVRKEDS